MRYTGPKARMCRREGSNIFGAEKYSRIMSRRKGLPGVNRGSAMKMSDFGKQLREKQKLKMAYGLTEKQLFNIYKRAVASKGITSDIMMRTIESRLDNVIYRAGMAATRMQARQMVSHGHFRLNGRRVNIPSIAVRPGDAIDLLPRLQASPLYANLQAQGNARWLEVDGAAKKVTVKDLPSAEDVDQLASPALVLEYYSR